MTRINLNAARAARAEARKKSGKSKAHELEVGDKVYRLPTEIPVDFSISLALGDPRGAVYALLGDVAGAEFWNTAKPTHDDMAELTNRIADLYELGFSSRSSEPEEEPEEEPAADPKSKGPE